MQTMLLPAGVMAWFISRSWNKGRGLLQQIRFTSDHNLQPSWGTFKGNILFNMNSRGTFSLTWISGEHSQKLDFQLR